MKRLLLVMLFTMLPVLAHGATYYVAKTGSDSNACSSAQSQSTPKLTINAGIRCLGTGDTLIVKAGTYAEQMDAPAIASGATIRSEARYGAIIRPNGGSPLFNFLGGQSNITVDGFVLDGTNAGTGYVIVFRSTNGSNNGITIANCDIRNMTGANSANNSGGIFFQDPTQNVIIRGNRIHDMGANDQPGQCSSCYSYGMYLAASGALIENNEIYNNSGYAIHAYNSGSGRSSKNIVRNNYIHDNGGPGTLLACGGDNNQFHNNIVARNGLGPSSDRGGLLIGGYCSGNPSSENFVYNNTFWNNSGPCVQVGNNQSGSSNNNTVQNNICWQNSTDNIIMSNGSGNTIDHNILGQNPLFINAAAGDFHLQNGSPAIDAGVVIPNLSYKGSTPDLGALESGTVVPSLPSPTNLRLVGN